VSLEVKPLAPDSRFGIELRGGPHRTAAVLGPGYAKVGDEHVDLGDLDLKPGEWTRVEFYSLDGAIRLFVGAERSPRFNRLLWNDERPDPKSPGAENSVSMLASGGGVAVRNIVVDRDIYYFSGRDQGWGSTLAAMTFDGEIDVPEHHFLPLGDNTTVSLDGRSWGAVDTDNLRGVALMIVHPKHRYGFLPVP
jgi:hypothetical protein